MHITRVILENYNAFALSEIKKIDVNMESAIQLILGTNGSGKTSFLRQLNPSPMVPGEFGPKGIKHLYLDHEGSSYECISVKHGSSAKHSFIKDGEVLCEGETSHVYKDLVARHLGYTDKIHNLLLHNMDFIAMTPSARQKTLMDVSTLSLDYALSVHEKLLTARRNAQGVISHLEKKEYNLCRELELLGDTEGVLERKKTLSDHITELLPLRDKAKAEREHVAGWEKIVLKAESYAARLMSLSTRRISDLPSLETATETLASLREEKVRREVILEETTKQLDELSKYEAMVSDGEEGIDALKRKRAALKETVDAVPTTKVEAYLKTYGGNLTTSVAMDINAVARSLYDGYTQCPTPQYPSEPNADVHIANIDSLKSRYTKIVQWSERARIRLEHDKVAKAEALTCPKCNTAVSSSNLLTEEQITDLNSKLEKSVTETQRLSETLLKAEEDYAYLLTFKGYMDRVRRIINSNVYTREQVGDVDNKTLHADLRKIIEDYEEEANNIEQIVAVINAKEELTRIDKALKHAESFQASSPQERKKILETRYEETALYLKEVNAQIGLLDTDIRVYNTMVHAQDTVNGFIKLANEEFNAIIETECVRMVELEIERTHLQLGEISTLANKHEHLSEIITLTRKELQEVKKRYDDLTHLITALSPKDGLIAEQMQGFIADFIGQMNNIIEAVWEYPLSVNPCEMENGKLSYKFTFNVDEGKVGDVGLASKGQREIINFAFIVTVLGYKGLSHYPMFLDEVGGGFDYQHRGNFIRYIKKLVDSRQCEQLIIVNHYSSEYGGMANADTLVLSDKNIVVPKDYNTHATLVR